MYGLLWLLPTSGENVMPTALLETFTWKNGDMFDTYFTHCVCIHIYKYAINKK